MGTAGSTLRQPLEENKKADKDGRYIASLIRGNYEIGDVITVDTVDGARHFGFYGGIVLIPKPLVMVAGSLMNFQGGWNEKWLDHIYAIETSRIINFKALAMKQEGL